jgi:hypothetical protein
LSLIIIKTMTALAVDVIHAVASTSPIAIISGIGTSLIISTIITTTSSIGSLIKYLSTSNHACIKEIVTELNNIDLEFTISIIDQLVKEQDHKCLQDSIKKALIGVNDILLIINKELDDIKKAIEYHNTKYFNRWRSFSCQMNIYIIKQHNDILKKRYTILFDLLKIYNKN